MSSTSTGVSERGLPKAEVLRRPRVHLLLLVAETLGAAIFLWDGVPLYNQVLRNVSGHKAQPGVLWWAIAAVLIQVPIGSERVPTAAAVSGHPSSRTPSFLGGLPLSL
jgi:hypothetical protein